MASEQGPFYVSLGQRLRRARESAGMTQETLARALGLSRTSVTNLERGRQPLQVHLLVEAAKILSVEVTTLLPDESPMTASFTREQAAEYPHAQRAWIADVLSTPTTQEEKRGDR